LLNGVTRYYLLLTKRM